MLEKGYKRRVQTITKQVSVLFNYFGPKTNFKN